mmetsp:Transcript_5748/g.20809  ORF Transcript_5748/g.20809 Transcript_5748/m.20809 type:complete len:353 (+) Transcript_5748:1275-2333(+)
MQTRRRQTPTEPSTSTSTTATASTTTSSSRRDDSGQVIPPTRAHALLLDRRRRWVTPRRRVARRLGRRMVTDSPSKNARARRTAVTVVQSRSGLTTISKMSTCASYVAMARRHVSSAAWRNSRLKTTSPSRRVKCSRRRAPTAAVAVRRARLWTPMAIMTTHIVVRIASSFVAVAVDVGSLDRTTRGNSPSSIQTSSSTLKIAPNAPQRKRITKRREPPKVLARVQQFCATFVALVLASSLALSSMMSLIETRWCAQMRQSGRRRLKPTVESPWMKENSAHFAPWSCASCVSARVLQNQRIPRRVLLPTRARRSPTPNDFDCMTARRERLFSGLFYDVPTTPCFMRFTRARR